MFFCEKLDKEKNIKNDLRDRQMSFYIGRYSIFY